MVRIENAPEKPRGGIPYTHETKYKWLVDLLHSMEVGDGKRIYIEGGESKRGIMSACYSIGGQGKSVGLKKYKMKDRGVTIRNGYSDDPYFDVYVFAVGKKRNEC